MNHEKFLENEKIIVKAIVGVVTVSVIAIMSVLFYNPIILFAWILTPTIVKEIKG